MHKSIECISDCGHIIASINLVNYYNENEFISNNTLIVPEEQREAWERNNSPIETPIPGK